MGWAATSGWLRAQADGGVTERQPERGVRGVVGVDAYFHTEPPSELGSGHIRPRSAGSSISSSATITLSRPAWTRRALAVGGECFHAVCVFSCTPSSAIARS